jgi:hypothetical protein
MRWVGPVACIEEMKNSYKFLSENLQGINHVEHLGIPSSKKVKLSL